MSHGESLNGFGIAFHLFVRGKGMQTRCARARVVTGMNVNSTQVQTAQCAARVVLIALVLLVLVLRKAPDDSPESSGPFMSHPV